MESLPFDETLYLSTIKETAYDEDHNEYMLEDMTKVYNFDEIKEYVCNETSRKNFCRSADALHINSDGNIYLIEFKNRSISQVKTIINEVHEKAYDSILLLLLTFYQGKSFDEIRDKLNYIVVYNNSAHQKDDKKATVAPSESVSDIARAIKKLAFQRNLDSYKNEFRLDELKRYLYAHTAAVDVSKFGEIKEIVFGK